MVERLKPNQISCCWRLDPENTRKIFRADVLLIAKDVSEIHGNADGMMKKNGIAVFDPTRFEDISYLRSAQLTAVTCGINEKNTISVSV